MDLAHSGSGAEVVVFSPSVVPNLPSLKDTTGVCNAKHSLRNI